MCITYAIARLISDSNHYVVRPWKCLLNCLSFWLNTTIYYLKIIYKGYMKEMEFQLNAE